MDNGLDIWAVSVEKRILNNKTGKIFTETELITRNDGVFTSVNGQLKYGREYPADSFAGRVRGVLNTVHSVLDHPTEDRDIVYYRVIPLRKSGRYTPIYVV